MKSLLILAHDGSDEDEEIQPRLERLHYELEILQRLRDKAVDEDTRADWDIQVSVQRDICTMTAGELDERQADIARYEAIIAEIEADLSQKSPPDPTGQNNG
ncbi:MAG: hypothetical protein ACE5GO_12150 [Anaerolineales bacterium]